MSVLKAGLIQMALKGSTEMSPKQIRDKMIEALVPMVESAGKQKVQVLCFQEVLRSPTSVPARTRSGTSRPEAIPDGETTQLMREYARKHGMVIVVPIYEEEMTGVYYNTAAVIDADGTYLGKYRKNPHSAGRRLLGEVLLQAGQPRLPGVQDRATASWASTSATTGISRKAGARWR